MRLVHSISMTLLVSAVASLSACSSDPEDPAATGGAAGSGGSATGGAAGSATGGSAGSATGGAAGSATGGAAGSGMSGSGGTGVMDFPEGTQAGIQAFLDSNAYTMAPWKPETMPATGTVEPHLAARRYFNGTIQRSKAAGNNPPLTTQHMTGSMAVKEILEGTTVVGKMAMLRTASNWAYYCMSSVADRCYAGYVANTPYFANASGSCACHGQGAMPSFAVIPAP